METLRLSSLSFHQRKVFDYIKTYLAANGYSPSLVDIQEHLELASTFGVRKHIDKLCELGFLVRQDGIARSIRPALNVVDDSAQTALPSPPNSQGVSNPTPDPSSPVESDSELNEANRKFTAELAVRTWRENKAQGEFPDEYWAKERTHPETAKQIELAEFILVCCNSATIMMQSWRK
jgi:hypothetical protein